MMKKILILLSLVTIIAASQIPEYGDIEEIHNDANPTDPHTDPKKYYLEKYNNFLNWFIENGGEVKKQQPCDGECETSDKNKTPFKAEIGTDKPSNGYIGKSKSRTTDRRHGIDVTYRSSTSKGRAAHKKTPSDIDSQLDAVSSCLLPLLQGWGNLAHSWGKR